MVGIYAEQSETKKNARTQKIWQRKSNHFLKKFKCYDKIH